MAKYDKYYEAINDEFNNKKHYDLRNRNKKPQKINTITNKTFTKDIKNKLIKFIIFLFVIFILIKITN